MTSKGLSGKVDELERLAGMADSASEHVIALREALRAFARYAEREDRPAPADLGALTLAEFCEAYKIERSTLFKMRRDGIGPKEINIGRKVLITRSACIEWEQAMQARSDA
ncbi:helix-turn-helix transcriptional regulator [Caballeronia pedi]|nr:helix-turn-helix domain-containing protein [Caballeronia pedi]